MQKEIAELERKKVSEMHQENIKKEQELHKRKTQYYYTAV